MLKTRVITAAVLLVLFCLDLFYASNEVFALVLAFIVAAGAWEWSRLSGVHNEHAQTAYAVAVSLLALLCLYLPQSDSFIRWVMLAGFLFWGGALAAFYMQPVLAPVRQASSMLLAVGVVVLVIASLAIQYLRSYAPQASVWLLLYAFVIIWCMDIGAYFSGRRFGKRKLAPLISPGKSWEGVYGGLAVTAVLLLLVLIIPDWPAGSRGPLLLATVLAAVASVVGDLFESRMKRASGFKDSSQLLPGHGGVLDRLDGVLAGIPMFAFIWAWL